MDAPLITRCLEAYIIWLFGKWMFTETHVDTISARYISLTREIADAHTPADIVPRRFGSAVLAATYRALCNVYTKNKPSSSLLGCPLLLRLWSWERFHIGKPDVDAERPWDYILIDPNVVDLPTVGSVWTRREVNFAPPYLLYVRIISYFIKLNNSF